MLFSILLIASYKDCKAYKVSNWLIILGWVQGLIYQVYLVGWKGLLLWTFSVFITISILFLLFLFRMFGAADIKLISVISGFCGLQISGQVVLIALISGAVYSLIKCSYYRMLYSRFQYFFQYCIQIILSKQIQPYYIRGRDNERAALPFSIFLCIGYTVFVVQSYLN